MTSTLSTRNCTASQWSEAVAAFAQNDCTTGMQILVEQYKQLGAADRIAQWSKLRKRSLKSSFAQSQLMLAIAPYAELRQKVVIVLLEQSRQHKVHFDPQTLIAALRTLQ